MSVALITGANRGIGLELCRQLAARGDQVIAACRNPSDELAALGVRVEPEVDVGSDPGVAALVERLDGVAIDVLINNAGIMRPSTLHRLNFDACRAMFEINALGPLRVTAALLPNLRAGSKIGIITSRMGSVADNTSGGSYGYRMSKTAVNMAGKSLAHDLAVREIAVAILHPGWVQTDMTGNTGLITAETSAAGLIARIDELTLETSGGFWHTNGDELPW